MGYRWAAIIICLLGIEGRAHPQNPIAANFLGISGAAGAYPQPFIGTLAHQEFAWATVETSKGNFDFSVFDSYLAAAQQHGLVDPGTNTASMAITLANGTPGWAVSDQSTCSASISPAICTSPPDSLQDWKDFVTALAQHYNGTAMPNVRYYELWNEANTPSSWTGTNAQMAALAQAAYPIIHQNRNSLLLTPSTVGSATAQVAWMTAYFKAGGGQFADGGAFHGYIAAQTGITPFPMPEQDVAGGSIVTIATQMRAVFDQYGLSGKPMFQTEGGWGNNAVLSPATQLAWLSRYLLLQAGLRASANLQMAAWYPWSAFSAPAKVAYNQVYNWLVGATLLQPCAGIANGTWTCSLTRPGGYVGQAVWNTQGYIDYTAGLSYTRYRDLSGNTVVITPDAFIDVGPEPVLFEGTAPGTGLAPVISLVANAEGESPLIAPNTWMEIKGFNLARASDTRIWQASDFTNNQLPRQLDGVSVTVNGKPASVYYISPIQINVLTPPDPISGNVPVQVMFNLAPTPAYTAPSKAATPSFFVFNGGPYLAAEHANGKYLGPTTLYPGLSTPAKPGETIILYANGFGATSVPVQSGSLTQSGDLFPLPAIQIGGMPAQVLYAGLVGPGEFQFNIVVPAYLPDGDQTVTAVYNGLSTQPGLLITVQH